MAKDSKAKRIDEELVCADALAHCLKHQYRCGHVDVRRETDDPPDFWITIDGEKFAAEVTSIVTGEDYRANCRKLKEAIRRAAGQLGNMTGTYALLMTHRPELPRRTSSEWRGLVCRATSFIQATRSVASPDEYRLFKDGHGYVDIKKISAEGATVGLMGPVDAKWEGEIQEELCQIMGERIAEKRGKLEKKGVPDDCPQIMLLLYDAHGYGDTEDTQKALLKVEGYDWFHSIFWAASFTDRANDISPENPGRTGAFLYSRDKNWWQSPTTS